MLSSVLQNLLQSLFGEGIEKMGGLSHNRAIRAICFIFVLASSVFIAVASAFFWTTARVLGVTGLWQYTQHGGGAGWLILLPAVAAVTALLTLAPLSGRFSLVATFSAATFALALASGAVFQGGGQYALNLVTTLSIIASIPLAIFALVLAVGDVPPIDAPLARFSLIYWGRLKHLRALRDLALAHGWSMRGPVGRQAALLLAGDYDPQHPVKVSSGTVFVLSSSASVTYTLNTQMGSPRDILSFRISPEPAPKQTQQQFQGRMVGGTSEVARKPTLYYYVLLESGQALPATFLERMGQVAEAGRAFLPGKTDIVRATPFGLSYTRMTYRGLSARDADLEPLLRWMRELVALMEEVSPAKPGATPQP